MIFGQLLQSARMRAGLTREHVAKICGGACSAADVQSYELGEPVPRRTAIALYNVLRKHTAATALQWANLAATTRREIEPSTPCDADLVRRIARTLAGSGNRAVLLRGQLRAIADSGLIDP